MAKTFQVVRRERGRFAEWSEVESVLTRYVRLLKRDIAVDYPNRNPGEIESVGNALFIHVYACGPTEDWYCKRAIIKTAYGINLDSDQEDSLKPTNRLTTVYDETGNAVAEFTANNIFILFNMGYGPHSGELIDKIMEDYCRYSDPTNPNAESNFKKLVMDRCEAASRKNFFKIYKGDLENRVENYKQSLEEQKASILEIQSHLVRAIRRRERTLAEERVAEEILRAFDPSVVESRFAAISKLAVGGSIRVTDYTIEIPLGQIDIDYEGETYDIGEFDLIINIDGDNGGVECINKTRVVESCYHPHVSNDGECCLGNISDSIATLVGKMEFEVVVCLMIQFLKTCYEDGWMADVTQWPIKSQGGK